MSKRDDIVTRLRTDDASDDLLISAASLLETDDDEIESLRAEVAQLTAERDGPRNRCPQCDQLRLELGEARHRLAALPADWRKDSSLKTWFPITAMQMESLQAERDALLARVEAAELDAARYRWLTSDHNDPWVRQHCREILERMGVMSYSATSTAIDTALGIEQFHAIDAAMEGGK